MSDQEKIDLEELKKLKIEVLHKELDLIQGCINRMANNSFLIKGWWITSILAFLTLMFNSKEINELKFFYLAIATTFFCWCYNSYFLNLEKLYRKKYQWIIKNRQTSLSHLYDLNPKEYGMHMDEKVWYEDLIKTLKDSKGWKFLFKSFFSKELVGTYLLCIILLFFYA